MGLPSTDRARGDFRLAKMWNRTPRRHGSNRSLTLATITSAAQKSNKKFWGAPLLGRPQCQTSRQTVCHVKRLRRPEEFSEKVPALKILVSPVQSRPCPLDRRARTGKWISPGEKKGPERRLPGPVHGESAMKSFTKVPNPTPQPMPSRPIRPELPPPRPVPELPSRPMR